MYSLLDCHSTHQAFGFTGATCDPESVPLPSVGGVGYDGHVGLYFPGSADIIGPAAVRGPVGGQLAVHCRYGPGWETYRKWWCRGAVWSDCHILVLTDGSEREAKRDRVSIKDDWKSQMFTVTMEKLRWNDTDAYWCGIERTGVDAGVIVQVAIDPGKSWYMSVDGSLQGLLCPGP